VTVFDLNAVHLSLLGEFPLITERYHPSVDTKVIVIIFDKIEV